LLDHLSKLLHSTLLTLLECVLLQHMVTDDNLLEHPSELLHSTLLEHVLLLQHVVTDNHLVDDVPELLHSTPMEHAPAQGNSQNPTRVKSKYGMGIEG
jgi:hypothetical protein